MTIINVHAATSMIVASITTFGFMFLVGLAGWDAPRVFLVVLFAVCLLMMDLRIRFKHIQKVTRKKDPGVLRTMLHPIAGATFVWLIPGWAISILLLVGSAYHVLGPPPSN